MTKKQTSFWVSILFTWKSNIQTAGNFFRVIQANVEIRISILEIPCVPILGKTDNFVFLSPNLPKNGFCGWNFKNLSLDSESLPPRYHVSQFSVKMDKFEFFGLNLGKLPNYVRYFGSNIVEGVAESWVEAEWSCVEVDGAGWSWVHGLIIPI